MLANLTEVGMHQGAFESNVCIPYCLKPVSLRRTFIQKHCLLRHQLQGSIKEANQLNLGSNRIIVLGHSSFHKPIFKKETQQLCSYLGYAIVTQTVLQTLNPNNDTVTWSLIGPEITLSQSRLSMWAHVFPACSSLIHLYLLIFKTGMKMELLQITARLDIHKHD